MIPCIRRRPPLPADLNPATYNLAALLTCLSLPTVRRLLDETERLVTGAPARVTLHHNPTRNLRGQPPPSDPTGTRRPLGRHEVGGSLERLPSQAVEAGLQARRNGDTHW